MNSNGPAYGTDVLACRSDASISACNSHSTAQASPEDHASVFAAPIERNDEVLLAEVRSGSRDALALLFRRYQRAVFNVAWRILRDVAEAEDLRQEVFLFLFQKASLFHADKGSAASWIMQITYHRAIDRRRYLDFRQHYNFQELDEERLPGGNGLRLVDEIAGKALLDRMRNELSPDQQQTLELHFFDGYSFREIAEKTGQSFGNIRNHYYRGMELLRSSIYPRAPRTK